jgi:UDP-2,3-diacylglucosamine pyrophosphatase LpxH
MATKDDSLMTETPAFFSRLLFSLTAPPEPGRRRRKPRADVLHRHRFGLAEKHIYRSIWISYVHQGTRGCQTDMLLDFLRHTESDHLYLVGDIIDCWRLRRSWFWDDAHDLVVRAIVEKARNGTKVVYIPGNHDEALRPYTASVFADIRVEREALHVTEMGETLLILHGDEFDGVVQHAKWLAFVGDYAYRALIAANTLFNRARRRLGFGYWSLSAFMKTRVKNALQFVENFEAAVADEARRRGVDGVICGHIHKAEMRDIAGVAYVNDGDWVESCTALVEHHDGRLEILEWAKMRSWSAIDRARTAPETLAAPLAA